MTETFDAAPLGDLTGRRMERRSPLLEEAWRYWSSLRAGRSLPLRDALDPRAMTLILGHAMILDRLRPGAARVRLGGRVMNALMGMEVRGLPIRAFFEVEQRARAVDLFERVFDGPATLEMDLSCGARSGAAVHARMLVLPLRDRDDGVRKALTCLALDRVDAEPPQRFRILRENLSPLTPQAALPQSLIPEARLRPGPRPYLRLVE
jgi:hypothetical protein